MQKEAEMFAIEKQLIAEGKKVIAGVDEAGRGPLAGPVVSAAVVLPEKVNLPDLDDSKKLTAKKREELFELITSQAVAWSIGMVDNDEIDEINILSAAMKSMRIAIENLKLIPDIALVDQFRDICSGQPLVSCGTVVRFEICNQLLGQPDEPFREVTFGS